ncbi:monovalent cation:proton antiporter-2 (CPA2) family protein [Marinicellulosiphila megalodicopiae]|uniref:monovalent cation:proton antiporter-2 (CPA2) family protein n=1 Tax=Marinicellulosiphila megalodicopiae TaxID=2724896 RepID=UPI003BB1F69A
MGHEFLSMAVIYLLAAVICVPIAKRLGLGSILGYLIAGILIGPFVLKLVGDQTSVMHFAEFGVVMMLFLVGMELKPALLWKLRLSILGLGGLQVGLSSAIFYGIFHYGFNYSWQAATAISLTLSLSSTAIVLQYLNEKKLLSSIAGQSSFSVLLFQDIAVIPILAIFPLLAIAGLHNESVDDHASTGLHLTGWLKAIVSISVIAAIVFVSRFILNPLFRMIAKSELREMFTVCALMIVVAIAFVMDLIGLSAALGTFIAGVVLADSEYRHQLEVDIEPFKGLLLGLFFISVGASMNFDVLINQPIFVLGITLLVLIVKMVVLFSIGKLFKLPQSQNRLFYFCLAQAGEFAFVLFSFANQNNVLSVEQTNPFVLVVALTMLITPFMLMAYERFFAANNNIQTNDRVHDRVDESNPVVVIGFGRVGQIIVRLLHANGYGTTILERDPDHIEMVKKYGYKAYYGDATHTDLLHSAGIEQAKLLVIALNSLDKSLKIIEYVRKHNPDIKILVRCRGRFEAYELIKAGIDNPYRETFSSSIEMANEALTSLGMSERSAKKICTKFKEIDIEFVHQMAEEYDQENNDVFIEKARTNREQLDIILKKTLDDHEEN